ncbi:outer membrane protein with beta-barrel domain [Thermoflavifilum aggregans]|uniref:Outer membrane protein with beta-barrel domain n=1 Tax=Thermoflavifilum aggregans TaxID=454188 RepID=A0A2M9CTZ7_9BACT|nr:DUF6089 family protein [Thermoflavifilum aggregans]PJJ75351.1 outer membrane protein with beta-barrel domain [Thermoflavifilum aggregans]
MFSGKFWQLSFFGICWCIIQHIPAFAQDRSIGILAGASNYTGDLQYRRYTFLESHPAIGIFYDQELGSHLAVRGMFSYATISGDDRYGKDSTTILRNLSFQSHILELQANIRYQLWDLHEKAFTPYVFVGLALFHFNPTALDTNGQRVALRPLSTEGEGLAAYPDRKPYSLIQPAIPFGGGMLWAISPRVRLGLEVGLRKTFTDYLDDVSKTYVDKTTLQNAKGPLAVRMAFRTNRLPGHQSDPYPPDGTIRGSSRYKDWYYYSAITLSITLPRKFKNMRNMREEIGGSGIPCPPMK